MAGTFFWDTLYSQKIHSFVLRVFTENESSTTFALESSELVQMFRIYFRLLDKAWVGVPSKYNPNL